MLDYNKLVFDKSERDAIPVVVTFEYSTAMEDIENFLLYEIRELDELESDTITSIEFDLVIFSLSDFKVECVLHGESGDYFIDDYIEVMHNAFEWLEQIPPEEMADIKKHIDKMKKART